MKQGKANTLISLKTTILAFSGLLMIAAVGCKFPLQHQVELDRYEWHKSRILAERAILELEKKYLPAHPKVAENKRIIDESWHQLLVIDEAAKAARKGGNGQ